MRAVVVIDSCPNHVRYAGEYTDPNTGLSHLRARDYDPATGRFTGLDPVARDIQDPYIASYVYADNQPTLLLDPSGLSACPPAEHWWEKVGEGVCRTGEGLNGAIQHPGQFLAGTGGAAAGLVDLSYVGIAFRAITERSFSQLYYNWTNDQFGITGCEPGTVFGSIVGPALATIGASELASLGRSAASTEFSLLRSRLAIRGEGGAAGLPGGARGYTPRGGAANYDLDELAQLTHQHVGAGDIPGRPTLSEIRLALSRGSATDLGARMQLDYRGVRVIINEKLPWRSTAFYTGQ